MILPYVHRPGFMTVGFAEPRNILFKGTMFIVFFVTLGNGQCDYAQKITNLEFCWDRLHPDARLRLEIRFVNTIVLRVM